TPSLRHEPGVALSSWSTLHFHPVRRAARITHLASMFSRSWRREPNPDELNELVNDYVHEEVLYREAKAMGLDNDDPVIRRRLRQKLEFLAEDAATQRAPTDDELNRLLQSEPERFRTDGRYSFSHVFLDPGRHRDDLADQQSTLRKALKEPDEGLDPSQFGDRFLLGQSFADVPANELSRLFGEDFPGQLAQIPLGSWEGPIQSSYGLHFIRLTGRDQARLPSLNEAREKLLREWNERERIKANAEAFARLRSRYRIVIEQASEPSRRQ
ncbi:peptidyl-prolyl cis-trans isomerase, partial [Bradyrhizobium elkanii]|uniref:peptidylprolyl isomerase n=1 Tax=Bradyrhizobium elkanii TaxID=29448 RepID=UPI001AEE0AB5